MFKTLSDTLIRINKPGMSDIWGLIPTDFGPVHFEIEVKTGKGVKTKQQKTWETFVNSLGPGQYYFLARDKDQVEGEFRQLIDSLPRSN